MVRYFEFDVCAVEIKKKILREGIWEPYTQRIKNLEKAQEKFLETCSTYIEGKYDQDDKDALLDQGYEYFDAMTVVLIDTSNSPTSDDDIRDELNKQPHGDMTIDEYYYY